MLETFYKSQYNTGMAKQLYKFIKENDIKTTKVFLNDAFEHTTSWCKVMSDKLLAMENVLDYFAKHIFGKDEIPLKDYIEMDEIIHRYDDKFHHKGRRRNESNNEQVHRDRFLAEEID